MRQDPRRAGGRILSQWSAAARRPASHQRVGQRVGQRGGQRGGDRRRGALGGDQRLRDDHRPCVGTHRDRQDRRRGGLPAGRLHVARQGVLEVGEPAAAAPARGPGDSIAHSNTSTTASRTPLVPSSLGWCPCLPPAPRCASTPAFRWVQTDGPAAAVRQVVAAATAADGADPLDEAALLALRHRGSRRLGRCGWPARTGSPGCTTGALDLVVDPPARGRGSVRRWPARGRPATGPLTAWSHGNHPAAAALAAAARPATGCATCG